MTRLPFRKVRMIYFHSIPYSAKARTLVRFASWSRTRGHISYDEITKGLHGTLNPNVSDVLNVRSERLDRGCPKPQGYQDHA